MAKKISMFLIAVLVQSLILASIPLGRINILRSGKTIRVKTVPVDPYDILSGYYVTLRYEFSDSQKEEFERGESVYVVLKKGDGGVYEAIDYLDERPGSVGGNEVFLKGRAVNHWRGDFKFGIEKYYMPEDMREEINSQIRKWQGEGQVLVDLKVDKQGRAAIVRLIINGVVYEY